MWVFEENTVGTNLPRIFPMMRGGELDPHERVPSLKDMEDEMKVTSYVGKRTGRRSVARTCTTSTRYVPLPCQSSTIIPSLDWLLKFMTYHAIGEFLHTLRLLYWSRETSHLHHCTSTIIFNLESLVLVYFDGLDIGQTAACE